MERLPEDSQTKSPGELYMAFGPTDRVVKAGAEQADQLALTHVHKGPDGLWRRHCGPEAYPIDDPVGDHLYDALRRLVDGCPDLTELEP